MKRIDFIRHIESNGCRLLREGGKQSVYINALNDCTSTVAPSRDQRFSCEKDLPRSSDHSAMMEINRQNKNLPPLLYTSPQRFRRNHSDPKSPTKSKKNGQVSQ